MGGISFLRVTQTVGDQPVTRFTHPFHAQCGASATANQSLAAIFISGVHGHAGMNAEPADSLDDDCALALWVILATILWGLPSTKPVELGWRGGFLFGLLVAGTVAFANGWSATFTTGSASLFLVILAGRLVGFGARLGGGCTSGHGACGISRLNPRSFVATAGFIVAGAAVVWVVRPVLGGAS